MKCQTGNNCYDDDGTEKCALCVTGFIGATCNDCDTTYYKIEGDNGAIICVLKKACTDTNMKCQDGNRYEAEAKTEKCLLCNEGYAGDQCEQCDKNNGYKPSDPSASPLTCVLACPEIPHCKSCEDDANKAQCDSGECVTGYTGATCNDCDTTYYKIEGDNGAITCALKKACTNTNMKCQTGNNCYVDDGTEKCALCVTGYIGATCNDCDTTYYKIEGDNGAITCVLKKACTDSNMKCQDGNRYEAEDKTEKCLLCNEGYGGATFSECYTANGFEAQSDGSCQKTSTPGLDCSSITGCEKCEKEENSEKLVCTECQNGEKPTELNTCPLGFTEESYDPIEVGDSGCKAGENSNELVITPDETSKGNNPVLTIAADSNINKIKVENSETKNLMLIISEGKSVTIEPPTGGKNNVVVDLENGATLTLPEDSSKVDIVGNKNVKLVSTEADKPITINKIRFDAKHKLEKIESNSNLNIAEMDIFGAQKFEGNDKMKCTNLKVEKGATFNPQKISFENARVGLESILNIDSPVNVDHYWVAYNEANPNHIPIRFSGSKPNLDGKDIQLFKQNAASTLEEKKTTLASFQGDGAKDACNNLEFKKNNDVDMKSAKCEDASNNQYNLVASSKKKGGLNAGAIAGIVIACVVVVAAIIALLVYFLVIKKKNESTTSTQGDSSIAI